MRYEDQVLEFNDFLVKAGIDPGAVILMRHRPAERQLNKALPWLAAEHPEIYNAYQQTQGPRAEKALQKADYLASFIGHEAGRAVFVGLYRRGSWRKLTYEEYRRLPACRKLFKHGAADFEDNVRDSILWFDLAPTDFCKGFKGRLVVDWPGLERSWWRWSERNRLAVRCIHDESILTRDMPDWNDIYFTLTDLKIIPSKWKAVLSQWRGIYFILDERDGKGYVGSASGAEHLLGRWQGYARQGHGGNAELRGRDPAGFRFSILQLLARDEDPKAVLELERRWKLRLHTRDFGMNRN